MAFCSGCGKEITEGSNSCQHCGKELPKIPQSTPASLRKKLPSIKKHSICALSLFIVDAFIFNQGIISALILTVSLVSLIILGAMLIFKKERDSLKKQILIAGIYAVMALLVLVSNYANNRIAMKNAEIIIAACEDYKDKHGNYPAKLEDLVPEFLDKVPAAKYTLSGSDFRYSAGKYLMYVSLPPFGRPTYSFESQKWGYLD